MLAGALVAGVTALAIGNARAAEGSAAAREPTVTATLLDAAGKPLAKVVVFSADRGAVMAMAQTDHAGVVQLPPPRPRYNFGLLSPTHRLHGVTPRGPGRFDLIAAALPPPAVSDDGDPPVARISAGQAMVFHGRVVDEAGRGLQGVRLEAVRPTGPVVATVLSTTDGRFALVVPGGEFGVRASAPGLKALDSAQQKGELQVVMAIVAEPQVLTFVSGRTLNFRPADSIDPEYTPPAPVRAWLRYAYGICPTTTPLKAHEKRNLKKYWYLDVLRQELPNPASISTVTCTPPSTYQLAPGQATIGAFETWADGLLTGPLR